MKKYQLTFCLARTLFSYKRCPTEHPRSSSTSTVSKQNLSIEAS
jgi:hypothetical protein